METSQLKETEIKDTFYHDVCRWCDICTWCACLLHIFSNVCSCEKNN